MTDSIDVNVTGRLMLLLTKQGLLDNRCLSIYKSAVCDVVRKHLATDGGDGFAGIDRMLDEQMDLLDVSLQARVRRRDISAGQSPAAVPDMAVDADATPRHAPETPGKAAREARASSGYMPNVKSMEEKLKDERIPVQSLLREDCVRVGLIDKKQAERLILGMTGKTSAAAEQDIVEQLRQTLQDQVKSFIRKSKGGPWGDPRTQEELRKDIHAARSVRSVLMLARQVTKEFQTWRDEHQRGGILGLFSARKRIVQG